LIVVSHEAKVAALHGFYSNLLGRTTADRWDFDLSSLYAGCPQVDGAALIGPFSAQEIRRAVDAMDRTSAPGPDGLGPSFYKAAWDSVQPQLLRMFECFFSRSVDL
jgi:hypothetical protein